MQSVKRLAVDTGIGAKRVYEIWTPYLNARWLLKTRHAKMQLHEMNVSSPLSFEAYTCPIWRHLAPHVQNANACKIHLFPHFTRPPPFLLLPTLFHLLSFFFSFVLHMFVSAIPLLHSASIQRPVPWSQNSITSQVSRQSFVREESLKIKFTFLFFALAVSSLVPIDSFCLFSNACITRIFVYFGSMCIAWFFEPNSC